MKRTLLLCALCLLGLGSVVHAQDWRVALPKAAPGTIITVPAGTFGGAVTVPPGVTLRGAGYALTTLDAGQAPVAVTLHGKGARVEGLTVLNKATGVAVTQAEDAVVSGVRILGGTIGVQVAESSGVRVENVVIAHALIGVTVSKVAQSTVANCTIYVADGCGLSAANATDTALFNNLVVNAGTGIVVGGTNDRLAIDYNDYLALSIGKIDGQLQRPSVQTWRDVSGQDAHSVQLAVTFANPATGDYHPVSTLGWNPTRVTTAGWGVAALGGHKAPAMDLDGRKRGATPDVGAYESTPLNNAVDGQFTVSSDDGVKSAGLFTPDGRLVAYLFQELPLRKGKHNYVLPARDLFGQAVTPGKYELRLVESTVGWEYRGLAANTGVGTTGALADSVHVGRMLLLPDGRLATGSGWSERGINCRLGDPKSGKALWTFDGSSDNEGLCLDGDGKIILLRNSGGTNMDFIRIEPATGLPIARPDGTLFATITAAKSPYLGGCAELGGKLYLADPTVNKVLFDTMDALQFTTSTDVPSPTSIVADRAHNLLWLVSNGEKVLALTPDGKVAHELTAVAQPAAVAVAGNRLVIASCATGKLHFFDITDPAQPREVKTLGRGDGPFGPWQPERFTFQTHPLNTGMRYVGLSMNEAGLTALREPNGRQTVFNADGTVLRTTMAVWGGDPLVAKCADGKTRGFDANGAVSYTFDAKAGTWAPDGYWGLPAYPGLGIRGVFSLGGKDFAVFSCQNPARKNDEWVLVTRYEQGLARPVLVFRHDATGNVIACRDTNGDGKIDDADAGTPVLDAAGKPLRAELQARFTYVEADGTVVHSGGQVAFRYAPDGLDADGVPRYNFAKPLLFEAKNPQVPSPYYADKTEDLRCTSSARMAVDGGVVAGINLHNTPNGMGLSNSGATDLARWLPDGQLRWLRTMNDYDPIQGVQSLPGVTVSSWGHQAEFIALDDNGLELARMGFPPAANWSGFWVDHPQEWAAIPGNDGNVQIMVGDYMQNCHHWFTLHNVGAVKHTTLPVTITDAIAWTLACRPPRLHQALGTAPPPELLIKKLPRALPIDGDMQKWRALGFPPQILLTPQNCYGQIDGPQDCSGTIRLGYFEHDLYAQVVVFDDVVSFHQPFQRFYKGDSLQFCINGFLTGFGFSLAKSTDLGDVFFRNRFFFQKMDKYLDPAKAPRVIKKFASAQDFPERQYIESIYGVDLSKCQVCIYEFKLPLDEETYKDDEKIVPPVGPGKWMWLGFMLNDNDTPGTDVQNFIAWPGTFGMFNPQETSAKAFFE